METDRTIISEEITKEAVDEIVKIGTKKKKELNYDIRGEKLPDNHSYSYREDLEKRMIDLVNEHRENNGLQALEKAKDLRDSARYKSLAMLQLNYFSHDNPNFSDESMGHLIYDIFELTHYIGIGENLGTISSTVLSDDAIEQVFKNLKESPGHNENMLMEEFEYIGVGVVYAKKPGSQYHSVPTILVTQHFGQENF